VLNPLAQVMRRSLGRQCARLDCVVDATGVTTELFSNAGDASRRMVKSALRLGPPLPTLV